MKNSDAFQIFSLNNMISNKAILIKEVHIIENI